MNGITETNALRRTRRILLLLALLLTSSLSFAQSESETTEPLINKEVVRRVAALDIEGTNHEDVTVTLKSAEPDYILSNTYRVKVKVTDKEGKTIYRKTFKDAFLYVFPDGQVQVGRKNFDQIVITPSETPDENVGAIREKEGVY